MERPPRVPNRELKIFLLKNILGYFPRTSVQTSAKIGGVSSFREGNSQLRLSRMRFECPNYIGHCYRGLPASHNKTHGDADECRPECYCHNHESIPNFRMECSAIPITVLLTPVTGVRLQPNRNYWRRAVEVFLWADFARLRKNLLNPYSGVNLSSINSLLS